MHAALVARHALSGELARAVANGDLRVHFQPIVELATGRVIACEALARWKHPTHGFVPPEEFISLAEETGSILALGRFVLAESAMQAGRWRRLGVVPPDFKMSINVSPLQLLQVDFVADVREVLEKSALPAEALIIEMTETVMLRDTQPTMAKLAELKELGVSIAVDDFGTGYSSLGYLRRFPVDILKIARDFVPLAEASAAEDGWAVANTIVALGRTMNIRIVAEGIEQPGQLRRLLEMGCEYGQGYLFLRPTDDSSFERYLGEQAPDAPPRLAARRRDDSPRCETEPYGAGSDAKPPASVEEPAA
jgi:EAL domain-containing protein (putative c-di-GMP-specific phosphodiesterase class I)